MRVGFFHDTPVFENQGNYYAISLVGSLWERYLSVFEEMTVSTRLMSKQAEGLELSSHPQVTFQPISAYRSPLSLFLRLPRIVKQIQQSLSTVDCAIIRLPSVIGWITCVVAGRGKKPILIEMVGCPWDAYRFHSLAGKLVAPFGALITKLTVRNAPFVIYVTKEFLQKRYPTRGISAGISDVNIQINTECLHRRLEKIKNREKVGRHRDNPKSYSDPIVIGSIGKIDLPYKGHRLALEAISQLVSEGFNLEYQIVGPGNRAILEEAVKDYGLSGRVVLKGALSSQAVHDWLDDIDLYVQPSFVEGLPRAVVEAMSHGLPAVLSDAGGQPELVGEEFLFPAGNVEALATTLRTTISKDWDAIARRNFKKSSEYNHETLQNTRRNFLSDFRDFALEQRRAANF